MKQNGFTLIEMVVTVAIVGILAAVAWPAYERQSMKNRRSVGVNGLLNASNELERCRSDVGGYIDKDGNDCTFTATYDPDRDYYTISTTKLTVDEFTLKATRKGPQLKDGECGDLTLTHLGQKGINPTNTTPEPVGTVNRCWSN